MPSSLKIVLSVILLFAGTFGTNAQTSDYLKHRRFFDVCSIKKQCSECHSCGQNRYIVKLQNNDKNKNIKSISYKFYSPVFNKIIEKDAKITGDRIEARKIGYAYVCVLDVRHWIFSKVAYEDGSVENFTISERLENFLQEADECDCND